MRRVRVEPNQAPAGPPPARRKRSSPAGESATSPAAEPDLPAPETILSETQITSPKGNVYRIIRTNQTDADEPEQKKPRRQRDRG
jgi:hypothetical protein